MANKNSKEGDNILIMIAGANIDKTYGTTIKGFSESETPIKISHLYLICEEMIWNWKKLEDCKMGKTFLSIREKKELQKKCATIPKKLQEEYGKICTAIDNVKNNCAGIPCPPVVEEFSIPTTDPKTETVPETVRNALLKLVNDHKNLVKPISFNISAGTTEMKLAMLFAAMWHGGQVCITPGNGQFVNLTSYIVNMGVLDEKGDKNINKRKIIQAIGETYDEVHDSISLLKLEKKLGVVDNGATVAKKSGKKWNKLLSPCLGELQECGLVIMTESDMYTLSEKGVYAWRLGKVSSSSSDDTEAEGDHLLIMTVGRSIGETYKPTILKLQKSGHMTSHVYLIYEEKFDKIDEIDAKTHEISEKPLILHAMQVVEDELKEGAVLEETRNTILKTKNVQCSRVSVPDVNPDTIRKKILDLLDEHKEKAGNTNIASIAFNITGGLSEMRVSMFLTALLLDAAVYLTPGKDESGKDRVIELKRPYCPREFTISEKLIIKFLGEKNVNGNFIARDEIESHIYTHYEKPRMTEQQKKESQELDKLRNNREDMTKNWKSVDALKSLQEEIRTLDEQINRLDNKRKQRLKTNVTRYLQPLIEYNKEVGYSLIEEIEDTDKTKKMYRLTDAGICIWKYILAEEDSMDNETRTNNDGYEYENLIEIKKKVTENIQ